MNEHDKWPWWLIALLSPLAVAYWCSIVRRKLTRKNVVLLIWGALALSAVLAPPFALPLNKSVGYAVGIFAVFFSFAGLPMLFCWSIEWAEREAK